MAKFRQFLRTYLVTLTEAEEGKMYKQGKVISGQKYRDKQRKG